MTDQLKKGPIAWMASNSVASNLLMFILIIGGLLVALRVKKEVFPNFDLGIVRVSVLYPGASPEEVEEGVILSIEDEVRSLDGVKRVASQSFEGRGIVNIELLRGVNETAVLQDVKNVVDGIQSFPEVAERPIVSLLEKKNQVVTLIVHGSIDKKVLREVGEGIRDELIQKEGITLVELTAVPNLEIGIEIPSENLRAYNLKLEDVGNRIRSSALDLPGGGVKTSGGEVLLRTKERRDFAGEFAEIPIVSSSDGSQVMLSDIANVKEAFEDTNEEAFFNGEPAVLLNIYRVGNQNPLDISKTVNEYAAQKNREFPASIRLQTWNDSSEVYRDRINLLVRNAAMGLLLVLIFLGLFLEPSLAFWVTLGIPVSIIGSFLFVDVVGASINMISLFAFILTLGIIVDDAILVGENIYHYREKGMSFLDASILGAKQIAGPVTFAVLTNIMAFIPLFFVPGPAGKLFMQIPAIVVAVFVVSLVESLFILPSHLTHKHKNNRIWKLLNKPNVVFEKLLKKFIDKIFVPQLEAAMAWRYLTLVSGVCILVVVLGLFAGGHIKFSYLPKVDSDLVSAQILLPYGAPIESTKEVQKRLVEGAKAALEKVGDKQISRGIYSQIGTPIVSFGSASASSRLTGTHLIGAQVLLVPSDQREISGVEFANLWRKEVGSLVGVETSSFQGVLHTGGGPPIDIQLSHSSTEILEQAAQELADELRYYEGVYDIDDGVARGKPQLSFQLQPHARSLGITTKDLAEQVRNAFYGTTALRQQRGRNEMKVMVRLPENERKSIKTIEEMVIRTPMGGEIPISEAAIVRHEHSYTSINRTNGRRVLAVTADVDEQKANAAQITENVVKTILPKLFEKHPGLSYSLEGEQKEQSESMGTLLTGFVFALFGIYALLAIPFRSYAQPIIVMLSIPFGIIGAVLGHVLLGYELSIVSMFGIVALAGVVVNDSLVLVVTANQNVLSGMSAMDAIIDAGRRRFRPIMLTSLTTFFGLAPMIFETSMQARFLIPMAISLGFGILFSTLIILLITTAFYLILDDVKQLAAKNAE